MKKHQGLRFRRMQILINKKFHIPTTHHCWPWFFIFASDWVSFPAWCITMLLWESILFIHTLTWPRRLWVITEVRGLGRGREMGKPSRHVNFVVCVIVPVLYERSVSQWHYHCIFMCAAVLRLLVTFHVIPDSRKGARFSNYWEKSWGCSATL